ncbi:winged helix-turn-helix transcriptional regulator [Streptomyces anulatus]|uniref:winged helix-turn-helix transcriptional regulator n=1 Tax=Streptomyces anulatus TaxID=1892 RepID=UPI0033FA344C
MALTGLPPDTDADIARVTEVLAMITPRWNVRIMLALSGRPMRYKEIADDVSWLQHGQLHPRLRALCDAGLIERTEHTTRHVTYGHTERGTALLPLLPLIVTWAEAYLEQPERPLPAIEQIEDSLTLLTRRHAAAILWTLRVRGEVSGRALAKISMPDRDWTNVYPPLRQLVTDGLVHTEGIGQPYRLSEAGDGLAPVLGALSAWAAGQPLAQAAHHPVWGSTPSGPAPTAWISNPPRPAPSAWHKRDLFSHAPHVHPKSALATGAPRR